MKLVEALKDSILNAAFPQPCHVCRGSVEASYFGVACKECWAGTKFVDDDAFNCSKCSAFLNGPHPASGHCPCCREHHYDRAAAVGVYENAFSATVLNLKRMPVIPSVVVERIIPALERHELLDFDVLISVPLSSKRRVERGFNQAEVIGDTLARLTRIPTDYHSIVRKKHTPVHRAAMDRKAREMTVKNAFEVRRPKLIEGKSVLLVDDIFTSGATVSTCAKVLKKSGASRVGVFTLARAEIRSRQL